MLTWLMMVVTLLFIMLLARTKGRVKIAETILLHGAKINKKDKFGCTPLHRAASTGNSELCELLIEEGAEVDAVDRAGQTPLMTAVICQHKQVALLLIRHGPDVDIEDKEGYTVLRPASNNLRSILIDAAKAMVDWFFERRTTFRVKQEATTIITTITQEDVMLAVEKS